eukprot:TRINITY_DN40471_c0_g1_i1.p1 TRINITY_DN40471_c0_g1~~TRINITY_DN40471_c0_g1_i1.p1  ORF type:complete len:391 (-),score=86.07 TRINITY_DN40471_c0_g1_i1:71-1243(-)
MGNQMPMRCMTPCNPVCCAMCFQGDGTRDEDGNKTGNSSNIFANAASVLSMAAEEISLDDQLEKELASEVELWRMDTSSAAIHTNLYARDALGHGQAGLASLEGLSDHVALSVPFDHGHLRGERHVGLPPHRFLLAHDHAEHGLRSFPSGHDVRLTGLLPARHAQLALQAAGSGGGGGSLCEIGHIMEKLKEDTARSEVALSTTAPTGTSASSSSTAAAAFPPGTSDEEGDAAVGTALGDLVPGNAPVTSVPASPRGPIGSGTVAVDGGTADVPSAASAAATGLQKAQDAFTPASEVGPSSNLQVAQTAEGGLTAESTTIWMNVSSDKASSLSSSSDESTFPGFLEDPNEKDHAGEVRSWLGGHHMRGRGGSPTPEDDDSVRVRPDRSAF